MAFCVSVLLSRVPTLPYSHQSIRSAPASFPPDVPPPPNGPRFQIFLTVFQLVGGDGLDIRPGRGARAMAGPIDYLAFLSAVVTASLMRSGAGMSRAMKIVWSWSWSWSWLMRDWVRCAQSFLVVGANPSLVIPLFMQLFCIQDDILSFGIPWLQCAPFERLSSLGGWFGAASSNVHMCGLAPLCDSPPGSLINPIHIYNNIYCSHEDLGCDEHDD